MPFQKEFEYPSDEELTVQEVNMSSSYLRTGSLHLGKYCEKENNEFMLCRSETGDPRKCLKEGRDVTNCSLKFFCQVKKLCYPEFEQFRSCVNKSYNMEFRRCRKTQAIFDKCMLEKMGLERPPFGWHAEVHIHETTRPKPAEKHVDYYPDAPDSLPPDTKFENPKYGNRSSFW